MKLVIINGSPRKEGRTGKLGRFAADAYGAELIDLSEGTLPLFNGEAVQSELEVVQALRKAVGEADGIILTSPEYHSGMSGALKNALDFLNSQHFQHKPTALIAVAGGGKGGINALNNMRVVARGLYANVISKQVVLDPICFTEEGTLTEEASKLVDDVVTELQLYVQAYQAVKQLTV
ncbi:MAG TPA: NADPH-dependent FMN reductase [Bacillus sp. (in: firmicutes)]|nr:NADPH-dependent FMN reductase [Bacillus sp. (in: firmicutes)]